MRSNLRKLILKVGGLGMRPDRAKLVEPQRFRRLRLTFLRTITFCLGVAGLSAQPAKAEVYTCTPALPFYCANIHIGCAGRSTVPTSKFTLSFEASEAIASFADGTILRSRVVMSFAKKEGAIVLRDGRDWIRIESGGAYSQRIYRKGAALMTRGTCGSTLP